MWHLVHVRRALPWLLVALLVALAGAAAGVSVVLSPESPALQEMINDVTAAEHQTFTAQYITPTAPLGGITFEQRPPRSLEILIGRNGFNGVWTLVVGSRVYQCPIPRSNKACIVSAEGPLSQSREAPVDLLALLSEVVHKARERTTWAAQVYGYEAQCIRYVVQNRPFPEVTATLCTTASGILVSYRDDLGGDIRLKSLRDSAASRNLTIPKPPLISEG